MDAEVRRRIDTYNEAIAKGGAAHIYTRLADLYRENGMLDNAVDTAKNGLDIFPGSLSIQQALGLSYTDMGKSESAVRILAPIVEKLPDNGPAAYGLTLALGRMGRNEDAMKVLKRRLEKDPLDKDCIDLCRRLETGQGAPLPPRGQQSAGRASEGAALPAKELQHEDESTGDDFVVADVNSLFKPGDELLPDELIDLETVFDEEPRPLKEIKRSGGNDRRAEGAKYEAAGGSGDAGQAGAEDDEATPVDKPMEAKSDSDKPAGFFKRLFSRGKTIKN
jgi:tetratricopeptide (TPR) repeat protein